MLNMGTLNGGAHLVFVPGDSQGPVCPIAQ